MVPLHSCEHVCFLEHGVDVHTFCLAQIVFVDGGHPVDCEHIDSAAGALAAAAAAREGQEHPAAAVERDGDRAAIWANIPITVSTGAK